jgi:hypothetical protein
VMGEYTAAPQPVAAYSAIPYLCGARQGVPVV